MTSQTVPDAESARSRLFTLFGALMTLGTILAGVGVLFWRDYQVWGRLPELGGNGPILYDGVGAAILIASLYPIWAWQGWRDPNAD